MSQEDYVVANGTGAAVRADLNNQLAAIVSNNSGATAPTTTFAFQWWADTTTGLLKIRNAANTAFITVGTLASANLGLVPLNGAGGTPTSLTLTNATGLPVAGGGTGAATFAANGILFGNGTSAVGVTAVGTATHVLTSNGTGVAPTFQAVSSTSDKISEGNTEAEVVDTGSNGHFKVTTEGTERARVDSSGRLLVGTATARSNFRWAEVGSDFTPMHQVEGTGVNVNQSISITNNAGDNYPPILFLGKSRGSSVGSNTVITIEGERIGQVVFAGNDGTRFLPAARIEAVTDAIPGANDMPGRLVFSTTADGAASPTERLRISSDGTFTGSASNDISDQRLKHNIQTIADPVEKVKALIGRTFEWKPEAKMQSGVKYGFIAQEIETVVPELVECNTGIRMLDAEDCIVENPSEADSPCEYAKSIQSSGVLPILVEAFKEALAKIETLEAKVTALEAS